MLGTKRRRQLKDDAVPTIFQHLSSPKKRVCSEKRNSRKENIEVSSIDVEYFTICLTLSRLLLFIVVQTGETQINDYVYVFPIQIVNNLTEEIPLSPVTCDDNTTNNTMHTVENNSCDAAVQVRTQL